MRLWLARIICPASHRVVSYAPTKRMIKAACKSMSPGARSGLPWVSVSEKHTIRYQAMIDVTDDRPN